MDDKSYSEDTVTIDGEEINVDAVRDPRAVKMGVWHARGVYRGQYVMAQGDSIKAAYENWEEKARELISTPEPADQGAGEDQVGAPADAVEARSPWTLSSRPRTRGLCLVGLQRR